jgi:hypothetical protein
LPPSRRDFGGGQRLDAIQGNETDDGSRLDLRNGDAGRAARVADFRRSAPATYGKRSSAIWDNVRGHF